MIIQHQATKGIYVIELHWSTLGALAVDLDLHEYLSSSHFFDFRTGNLYMQEVSK